MVRRAQSWVAIASFALAASCESAPPAQAPRDVVELDRRGSELLVGARAPLRPESDEPPRYEVTLAGSRDVIASDARAAGFTTDAIWFVDGERVLYEKRGRQTRRITDRVIGPPARLADQAWVVSRAGDDPGESDLTLVSANGTHRVLAAAPGPDDLPTALPDGRIAFVSGRTGVASLFVVDPKDDGVVQLTNRGLRRVTPDFVPPPVRRIDVARDFVEYDAGRGERWRIEIATGKSERRGAP